MTWRESFRWGGNGFWRVAGTSSDIAAVWAAGVENAAVEHDDQAVVLGGFRGGDFDQQAGAGGDLADEHRCGTSAGARGRPAERGLGGGDLDVAHHHHRPAGTGQDLGDISERVLAVVVAGHDGVDVIQSSAVDVASRTGTQRRDDPIRHDSLQYAGKRLLAPAAGNGARASTGWGGPEGGGDVESPQCRG